MSEENNFEDPLTEEFEKSEIFSAEQPAEESSEEREASPAEEPVHIEVAKLQQELKSEKDKYFRLLAEMENTRKRMQKEKEDTMRFSQENVLVEFLSVIDNFENALNFAQHSTEDVKHWAKGFEMILTQMKDILANYNVKPFSSEGEAFDPHLHEVIEMEETQAYPENTIIQEFVRGYKSGDRIIRPARVKVAKPHAKEEKENEQETKQEENKEHSHG